MAVSVKASASASKISVPLKQILPADMQSSKPLIAQGWLRAISFFVFFISIIFFLSYIADVVVTPWLLKNPTSSFGGISKGFWLNVLISMASAFFSVWVFRRFIDRQSIASLGFAWQGHNKHAFAGFFAGIAMIGGASLVLIVIGHLHFTQWHPNPVAFINSIIAMILVAVSEELVLRGYFLHNLMQSTNKWLALVVSAVLFAVLHIGNPEASILSTAEIFIGGLMLGINYIYTRNLWFGIFLHFAWNFFQGPVIGYKVSGVVMPSAMQQDLVGPAWLTGGNFGLEGSVLSVVINLMLITILVAVYNKKVTTEAIVLV